MFNTNLESILKTFNKTVTKLEGFIEVSTSTLTDKTNEILKLEEDVNLLVDEIAKASNIKTKIKNLIEG